MKRTEINKKYRERKIQEDPNYLKKESQKRKANRLKKKEQEEKDREENPENYSDNEDEKVMEEKGLDKSQKQLIDNLTKEIKAELIKPQNPKTPKTRWIFNYS